MIPYQTSRALFNNQYAQAAIEGDPRFQAKQMDRGGVSRGAGTQSQAGIQGASKLAEGVAEAYKQRAQANQYNVGQALQIQQANDLQSQAMTALQQQQAYQDAMARTQKRNMGMDFATSILGGLLR
jgi:hypothetical protein